MAAARRFDPVTVAVEGGGRRRVHRITCSECPTTHDVSANTLCGSRSIDDLMKVFRRGGWEVGRNPSRDLCPDCASAKRRKPKTPAMTAEVIPMSTKPAVEPPAQPTFEDRRIIIAKLQEVYIDEKVGYDRGWSDKRVGEHLGVPWKWVADLRDANFGPARDNDDVREAIEEARALKAATDAALVKIAATLKIVEEHGAKLTAEAAALRERQGKLDKRIADIEKAVR